MMMTSKKKKKCNESNYFLEYNKIFEEQEINLFKCIWAKPARRNPFNYLKIVSILVFFYSIRIKKILITEA